MTTLPKDPLPNGTPVLYTADGEPGTIVNGYAFDLETGEWTEYEVETAYGIEVLASSDLIIREIQQ